MIIGVLLAAGRGERFGDAGGGKLVQSLGGEPLIRHAARALLAAGLDRVHVVLGANADAVRAALSGLDVRWVHNPRFAEGIGTSVAAGIAAVSHDADAAVIALGDQPLVREDVIRALVSAWESGGATIAAPSYDGVRGNPVLFSKAFFQELMSLDGDIGARSLLERHKSDVRLIPISRPMPADIDTAADLERLRPNAQQGREAS